MWIVCITSVRHVLTVNGYGGRQTKENEKSWCFKGWETLVKNYLKMVRIDFFTKKDAEYSDYMRYIIANTLQEYEGEVTLNQIPENKATEEEISKYGIEVYPTIIVSGDNMDGFNKLEGMARKADLINVMSLYDKK